MTGDRGRSEHNGISERLVTAASTGRPLQTTWRRQGRGQPRAQPRANPHASTQPPKNPRTRGTAHPSGALRLQDPWRQRPARQQIHFRPRIPQIRQHQLVVHEDSDRSGDHRRHTHSPSASPAKTARSWGRPPHARAGSGGRPRGPSPGAVRRSCTAPGRVRRYPRTARRGPRRAPRRRGSAPLCRRAARDPAGHGRRAPSAAIVTGARRHR